MSRRDEYHGPIQGHNVLAGTTISGGTNNFNYGNSNSLAPSPSPAPKPRSTVPFPPDPNYIDRPEILAWMRKRSAAPGARIALVGLGGIGKSQLAIRYAQVIREHSPDTWIFWVHGGTVERFDQGYRDIADALQLPGRNDSATDTRKLVYRWLCDEGNGKWLMILDNADDIEVFYSEQHHLATFLPMSGNGSIVVTSRSSDVAYKLTGNWHDRFEMPLMDTGQACRLLREKLETNYDDAQAPNLAEALGHMPLALTQAAAFINRRSPRMSISAYLQEFHSSEKKKGSLLHQDSGDLRRDPSATNSVVATWQITIEQIQRERESAGDLLSFMSLFNPQSIPEWALRGSMDFWNDGQDADFDDDIEVLRGYSLVKTAGDNSVFDMHPLVQHCTRTWLTTRSTDKIWRRKFLRSMYKLHPRGNYEDWVACRDLEPHVASILQEAPGHVDDLGDVKRWVVLTKNVAWYHYSRGRYSEAERLCRPAFEAGRSLLGIEHAAVMDTMKCLGATCCVLGEYDEAEQLLAQLVELRRELHGDEDPRTLTSMHDLAWALSNSGKNEEAEQLLRQVLEKQRKVLKEEDPGTLATMFSLVWALSNLGRYEEAEQVQQQALEGSRNELPLGHPATMRCMLNLGETSERVGNHEEAERLYKEALGLISKYLGEHHLTTLQCASLLARILSWKDERLDEAAFLCETPLSMFAKVYEVDHPYYVMHRDIRYSTR